MSGPPDDSDDEESPTDQLFIESAWDEDDLWVTLLSDSGDDVHGDHDHDAHAEEAAIYALTIPDGIREALVSAIAGTARRLGPDLEVAVTNGDGESGVWDNATLRAKVRDAEETCLAALALHDIGYPEVGPLDAGELVKVAVSADLLVTLRQFAVGSNDPDSGTDELWVDALVKLGADCETMILGRIRPRRDGSISLRWHQIDRDLIEAVSSEVAELISSEDPTTARLFPSAYGDDAERNAGWDAIARRELVERRLEALGRISTMLNQRRCTADELGAFMRSINDARLVLGTRLGVDDHGPSTEAAMADRGSYAAYEHLTYLLAITIRALRTTV